MTDLQFFEEVDIQCKIFRGAIESSLDKLDEIFQYFPRGCCGDTAALLAAHLKDVGLGTFSYVSGWDPETNTSHAWLEKNSYMIDITPDQFESTFERPFVTDNDTWYQRFYRNKQKIEDGDFRIQIYANPNRLRNAYCTIQASL